MKQKMLILASSSPRRQELIQYLELPVQICASEVNEETEEGLSPVDVVETLSFRKAEAVLKRLKTDGMTGIIVGSDTIVELDGQILGKPKDTTDAVRMLKDLEGKQHQVFTGVACIDIESGHSIVKHRVTKVTMKALNDTKIKRYVETGEPFDKAGSYGIQGKGSFIIESIEGCYFNVVGLPLSLLSDMLEEMGMEIL